MHTHKVDISGMENPMQLEGTAQVNKIALVNRVVIPPRFEEFAEGKICAGPDGGFSVHIGLVEPSEKLLESDSAMLARSLVRRQERVPLRLMNMSAINKTIQPGTVVGTLSPVSEMVAVLNSEGAANNIVNVPKHLERLFDSSTKYLEARKRIKQEIIFFGNQSDFLIR